MNFKILFMFLEKCGIVFPNTICDAGPMMNLPHVSSAEMCCEVVRKSLHQCSTTFSWTEPSQGVPPSCKCIKRG
jgi:hypothetical protein